MGRIFGSKRDEKQSCLYWFRKWDEIRIDDESPHYIFMVNRMRTFSGGPYEYSNNLL